MEDQTERHPKRGAPAQTGGLAERHKLETDNVRFAYLMKVKDIYLHGHLLARLPTIGGQEFLLLGKTAGKSDAYGIDPQRGLVRVDSALAPALYHHQTTTPGLARTMRSYFEDVYRKAVRENRTEIDGTGIHPIDSDRTLASWKNAYFDAEREAQLTIKRQGEKQFPSEADELTGLVQTATLIAPGIITLPGLVDSIQRSA